MGTRSSYRIIEKYDSTSTINDICVIYVHYDGYPKGHPLRICKWLSGSKMSLGYNKIIAGSSITNEDLIFNGAGCLAASLVTKLKTDSSFGNVYMCPFNSRGKWGEEFMYDIIVSNEKDIEIICYNDTDNILFKGTPSQFVEQFIEDGSITVTNKI
jgi:hypothetical protein